MARPKTENIFVKYHRNNKIHQVGRRESYVTAEYLYELLYAGERIHVIADDTQEDVTDLVIARLIYDKARKKRVRYDVAALSKIIVNAEGRGMGNLGRP